MVCAVSYSGSNRTLIPASFATVSNMNPRRWFFIFRSIRSQFSGRNTEHRKQANPSGPAIRFRASSDGVSDFSSSLIFPADAVVRRRRARGIRVPLDHRPRALDFLHGDIGGGIDRVGFLELGQAPRKVSPRCAAYGRSSRACRPLQTGRGALPAGSLCRKDPVRTPARRAGAHGRDSLWLLRRGLRSEAYRPSDCWPAKRPEAWQARTPSAWLSAVKG